jgi:prepilin-type N-terminal cleavage/methylation domain-containing protein
MRRQAGLTLVEILSVIVILSIMTATLQPVLSQAMMKAKMSSSGQRLRQLHLLTLLYQADQNASADHGNPEEMGLPWDVDRVKGYAPYGTVSITSKLILQVAPSIEKASPCGYKPNGKHTSEGIHYMPRIVLDWLTGSEWYGQNVILWVDPNCNSENVDLEDNFSGVRALGISLGGSLSIKSTPGAYFFLQDFFNRRNS